MYRRKAITGSACCITAIIFLAIIMYFIVAFVSATFDISKMQKEYKEIAAVVFFIFSIVITAAVYGTIFSNLNQNENDTDKKNS